MKSFSQAGYWLSWKDAERKRSKEIKFTDAGINGSAIVGATGNSPNWSSWWPKGIRTGKKNSENSDTRFKIATAVNVSPCSQVHQQHFHKHHHCHDVTWKGTITVRNLKPFSLFVFFIALACEKISIKTHSIENRCYRTGKYTLCRRVHAPFSPDILQAVAVKGLRLRMSHVLQ